MRVKESHSWQEKKINPRNPAKLLGDSLGREIQPKQRILPNTHPPQTKGQEDLIHSWMNLIPLVDDIHPRESISILMVTP